MEEKREQAFIDLWAVVELMGHRKLAGKITEVPVAGSAMLRIDVPDAEDPAKFSTQFYGGAAIYCITPTTESLARGLAKRCQPAPIQPWELPRQLIASAVTVGGDPEEFDGEDGSYG